MADGADRIEGFDAKFDERKEKGSFYVQEKKETKEEVS